MGKISSGSLTVVDVKGGSDGINTATIYLYQRAATAPSKPSTNLTYTFVTAKLTGGLGNWTQDIGTLTGSDPIWVIAAVASSNGKTDVIEPTEWSEPIKMAQDGQDGQPGAPGQPGAKGLNQATVFIYKRDDSVEKPNSVTYTFATGSFAVPTGWSTSIPQSNGKPCWVCSAVAIGSDDTTQLSWTNPSVMVEDGSDGVSPVVTSTDNGVQIYDPVNDVTYTITNGADGTSYYTHILYSSKATPTSASDVSTSPTGKDYVGIQTTTSRTAPSWNDSGWQWMKYVGNDGTSVTVSSVKYAKSTTDSQPQDSSFNTALPTVGEGEWLWTMTTYSDGSKVYTKSKQGKSGTSVTVSKTEYQAGTSATTAPTGEWKTTIPSVAEGQYLWTKTTYSDGNYSYTVAKQGKSGTSITISSTSVKYQVGTSATTAPTGEWQDAVQSTTTGQYLWTRTIVTYSDGSDTTSYSVSAHGAAGTSISISSIKYATSTTDSQPADSSFGTSIPTVSEGQWLWTMTTYSNGSKMYTKSKQGKSGVSVTKTRELYYLKTNSTNVPTITATSQITATDRVNGWTSIVPTYVANGTYYTCIETSLSVGGPVWSTPVENQGLTDANANAAESLSVSTHANENAQGALSISRATQQHFWFVPENIGSGASLIEAGAYITDTAIDTFKSGKNGGYLLARSDGVELGRGTNKFMTLSATALNFYRPGTNTIDATLTSNGLILTKGGLKVGTYNASAADANQNFVYLSSEDYGTGVKIGDSSSDKKDWRQLIGNKFGVDRAGNLYASGANITGKVTITSGSNVYTKTEADAAYDVKGAASTVQTNLDNLEIGGRNYVRDSEVFDGWSCAPDSGGTAEINDGVLHVITKGGYARANGWFSIKYSELISKPTTFSVDVKANSTLAKSNIVVQLFQTNQPYRSVSSGNLPEGKRVILGTSYATGLDDVNENTWTRVSWTVPDVKALIDAYNSSVYEYFALYLGARSNANGEAYFRKPKFEYGTKATDWTPAPEDVQAEIDAKKSVHTLNTNYSYTYANILTYSAEGYGGTAGASWSVSSTEGVKQGDTVRLKVTVSDMNNAPVYIIGTVVSITSAIVLRVISHGVDTTVIDGGNILTNSIGANQIAASSISIGKLSGDALTGASLLADADAPTLTKVDGITNRYFSDSSANRTCEVVAISDPPEPWIHYGGRITSTGAQTSDSAAKSALVHYGYRSGHEVPMSEGETYTLSFWARKVSGTCAWYAQVGSGPYKTLDGSNYYKEAHALGTAWTKITYSFIYTTAGCGGNGGCRVYPGIVFKANTAGVGEVCGVKLYAQDSTEHYITSINDNGIRIASANPATQSQRMELTNSELSMYSSDNKKRVSITSGTGVVVGLDSAGHSVINDDGLHVYNGTHVNHPENEVASFGSNATIGAKVASSSYLHLEPNKMSVFGTDDSNKETEIFVVGNLINQPVVDSFTGNGTQISFELTTIFDPYTHPTLTVKVNNVTKTEGTDYTYYGYSFGSYIAFETAPAAGAEIIVSYIAATSAPYMTIGTRQASANVGSYSVAIGERNTASGMTARSEGYNTTASGNTSHAEGSHTIASGPISHAEGSLTTASGWYAHAEGFSTTASGRSAHAEGEETTATGWYSHTSGQQTIANGRSQTVIGEFNKTQGNYASRANTDYAFIIGNGTADNARSNAFTIDWRGRIHNNNSSGTSWIDGRDEAKIQFHPTISAANQMHPYISMKTNVGAWQISTYQNNALYFAYTTDANYSSKTNSATGAYITITGAYTNMSDRKIKKNISSINNAKEFIMQLKPVQFNFKDIENDKLHMGFIAQEVAEAGSVINDDLAVYTVNYKNSNIHKEELITAETDDEELSWSLCYSELIAPMVKVIQDQEERISKLETLVEQLLDK